MKLWILVVEFALSLFYSNSVSGYGLFCCIIYCSLYSMVERVVPNHVEILLYIVFNLLVLNFIERSQRCERFSCVADSRR